MGEGGGWGWALIRGWALNHHYSRHADRLVWRGTWGLKVLRH